MRVHFVQQQKQQLEFESIGFNRAKIEIVCARRDQNCKFTFFIRIEFKGGEAIEKNWEHKYKREFNSHK